MESSIHNRTMNQIVEAKIAKGVEAFRFYVSQGIDRATAKDMVVSSSILVGLASAIDASI